MLIQNLHMRFHTTSDQAFLGMSFACETSETQNVVYFISKWSL